MYYRLFAAHYLPQQLDRILYLDPDLVVLNSLRKLYEIDFGDNLFAAASHIESHAFRDLNRLRLNLPEQTSYINSGVMMMNLKLLRNESTQEVIDYINEHKKRPAAARPGRAQRPVCQADHRAGPDDLQPGRQVLLL